MNAPNSNAKLMGRVWVAAGVFVALVVSGWAWLRQLPEYTESELAEAEGTLAALDRELMQQECSRPAFFGGSVDAHSEVPDSMSDALLGLIEDPELAGCRTFFDGYSRQDYDAFFRQDNGPEWEFNRGNDAEGNGAEGNDAEGNDAEPGMNYMAFLDPASPILREDLRPLERLCAGIRPRIERLAAATHSCSPIDRRLPIDADLMPFFDMTRVALLLARQQAGRGDVEGALVLLIQTYAVLSDIGRGPTGLLGAILSAGTRSMVCTHMSALLIGDPHFTRQSYARIDRLLEQLQEIEETPTSVFEAERIELARDNQGPAPVWAGMQTAAWCPWHSTIESCLAQLVALPPPASVGTVEQRLANGLLGVRGNRTQREANARANERATFPRYLAQMMQPRLSLQLVRILLRLTEARGREENCPTSVPLGLQHVAGSEEGFVLEHWTGDVYELKTPGLDHVAHDRVVARFICPTPSLAPASQPSQPSQPNDSEHRQ